MRKTFTNYKCLTTVTPSFVIRGCYRVSLWIKTLRPIGPKVIPAMNDTFDVVFKMTAFDASGVYIFLPLAKLHLKNFVNIFFTWIINKILKFNYH
jgi:hypothetical protein